MAKYNAVTGMDEPEDDSGLWYWFLVPVVLLLVGFLLDGIN